MVDNKKLPGIRKDDKSFRRDVIRAKMLYRKKRAYIILSICIFLLTLTLIRTYFYSREKSHLENKLREQETQIEKLQKDSKTNEVIINKLKDPYFLTDLVRQEYSMSYEGETIFNLPLKESYMQNAINSIMMENVEAELANTDKTKLINDENIEALRKAKEEATKKKSTTEKEAKEKTESNDKEE